MKNLAKNERLVFFLAAIVVGAISSLLLLGTILIGIFLGYQSRKALDFGTHLLSAFGVFLGLIPMTILFYYHFDGREKILFPALLLLVEPIAWIVAGYWCVVKGENLEKFLQDPLE